MEDVVSQDGAPERLRCETIQEGMSYILQIMSVLSCIGKKTIKGCDRGSKVGTVHSGRDGPVPLRKLAEKQERVVRKISSPSRIAYSDSISAP